MKILLVDDEPDVCELITSLVKSKLNAVTHEYNSGNDAISALKKMSDYDLIVSDFQMPNGNGTDLFRFCRNHKINIPFIIISGDSEKTIRKEFPEDNLINFWILNKLEASVKLVPLLNEIHKINTNAFHANYIPVKISILSKMSAIQFDLFIKLSDEKFIKYRNKNDDFTADEVNSLINRGIEQLYFLKEDHEIFLETIGKIIKKRKPKSLVDAESFHEDNDLLQTTKNLIDALGVNSEIIHLVEKNVELAKDIIQHMHGEIPALQHIVDKNKNYFTNHSLLTSYISASLAYLMNWGTDLTYSKLAYASLFHDISISEPEVEFANMNNSELNFGDLSKTQIQHFQSHPERSAEILSKIPGVPLDTDQIILYHHKLPDNSGFPEQLHSSRMIPLAALFNISHDMADFFIEFKDFGDEKQILKKFIEENNDKYQIGIFGKIFNTTLLKLDN